MPYTEKDRERQHRYYEKNKERLREKNRIKEAARREQIPTLAMFNNAKQRAKKFGLPFDIEHSDIVIPELCPYLEIELKVNSGLSASFNSPSLDRILPELGYVKGNVQVISYLANSMKNSATPEQLRTFCTNVLAELDGLS